MEGLEPRAMLSATPLSVEPQVGEWNIAAEVPAAVEGELLVGFHRGTTDQQARDVLRQQRLSTVERLYHQGPGPAVHRVTVPEAAIDAVTRALENHPLVRYAEPNYVASALWKPNDPYYSYQWHLNNAQYGGIHAEPAWETAKGSGAVVAVLDTGVAYENYQDSRGTYYQAPDLGATRFVAGYDFINGDAHANDDHSHGTHVAGTVAQSTNNTRGVAGVAFDASIMPVKVLDRDGNGSYSAIANGIKWAADHGADVINLSLGGGSGSQTMEDALAYAYSKGVTIVAAAGNDGINGVSYPAAYDAYVIAVSATRYDEAIARYSNYGSSIDLAAPGGDTGVDQNGDGYVDGVLQNTFNPSTKNTGDFGYYFFQGTSMASPHVAGVAALLVSQGLTSPADVRQILQSTAEDKGAAGLDIYYGHGIVDAAKALAAVSTANTAPVANNDSASTSEDVAVTVTVLANDSDADGDPLSVSAVGTPGYGTAVVNSSGTITYTPNRNFHGADSFGYTVSDGQGGSATAAVTVSVASVNDAPVAVNDSASTSEGTSVTLAVLANDSDVDGDSLTVASVTAPASGSVVKNADNTLTYSPKAGFTGTDSFSYTVADPSGAKATATVTVTVEPAATNVVYVSDLDGKVVTKSSRWQAQVAISVLDSSGRGVAGVSVSGTWSDGKSFAGTTDSNGRATALSAWRHKSIGSVEFTVTNVAHADYDPAANRDPDGDSNGTGIIVYKDGTTAAPASSAGTGTGEALLTADSSEEWNALYCELAHGPESAKPDGLSASSTETAVDWLLANGMLD